MNDFGGDKMKKLLFLYPIEEYMSDTILFSEDLFKKFNQTLDKRYRQQEFEINFLMFKDKKIPFLQKKPEDKILFVDITFERYINDKFPFVDPDNELIFQQVKDCDELVVCGFHAMDCVKKVANYCYRQGMNVLVDVELTDMFRYYSKQYAFNEEKYNLANNIECIKAENYYYGLTDRIYSNPETLFSQPYYQREKFKPDYNFEKVLEEMEKEKNIKIKRKEKNTV